MLDQTQTGSRLDRIVENLQNELQRQSLTPYALSMRVNPASKNMVSRLLAGKNIELSAFLAIEAELGLAYGELLRNAPTATLDDINHLLDVASENRALYTLRKGPSVEDFLRWYHQSGGNITPDNRLLEHIDIYDTPTDDGFFVQPIHIGGSSLAARKLNTNDPQEALQKLCSTNLDFVRQTAADHKGVFEGNSILDEREVNQPLGDGTIVTSRFTRSLRLGKFAGRPVVLNFANEI